MRYELEQAIAFEAWNGCLYEPYRWGGSDPVEGFDCSGLAIEGLKAGGRFARDADTSAAGLAKMYPHVQVPYILPGCLIFWARPGKPAHHVEIVKLVTPDGRLFTIGASGGGSTTTTAEAAARADAYVKIRPARAGWVWAVDPFLIKP